MPIIVIIGVSSIKGIYLIAQLDLSTDEVQGVITEAGLSCGSMEGGLQPSSALMLS